MALINPEIIGLARLKVTTKSGEGPILDTVTYDFANGFDVVEVSGALPGAPVIYVPSGSSQFVLFLSNPQQPGTAAAAPSTLPNQGGVKATFNIVKVSTPADPIPSGTSASIVDWQYGDYSLAAPYAKVNAQKALRVFLLLDKSGETFYIDVSVFSNPMTLYK